MHFTSFSENSFPQRGHFCILDCAILKNRNVKVPAYRRQANVKSMTNDLMSKYFCSFGFWISFEIWSLTFDIIFLQDYTPKYFIKKFSTPPTPKAIGKITADIHRVFLNPLSFIIIKNWAMQGIKRVRVTKLTRIW